MYQFTNEYLAKEIMRLAEHTYQNLEIYHQSYFSKKGIFSRSSTLSSETAFLLRLQKKLKLQNKYGSNKNNHKSINEPEELPELGEEESTFYLRASNCHDKKSAWDLFLEFVKFLYDNIIDNLNNNKLSNKKFVIPRLLFSALMEALHIGVNLVPFDERYKLIFQNSDLYESLPIDNDFERVKILMNGLSTPLKIVNAGIIVNTGMEVGSGTYSRILKGLQVNEGEVSYVAIKEFNQRKKTIEQQKAEFRIHSGLLHPNIAQVLSYLEKEQQMILTYYQLGNIGDLIRNKAKVFSDVIKFQLCFGCVNGVKYLHERKIVHGDLKPENILVDQQDGKYVPRITDFGESTDEHGTVGKGITVGFSAPELVTVYIKNKALGEDRQQEHEKIPYTQKSDIFSLLLIFVCIILKVNNVFHVSKGEDRKVLGDTTTSEALRTYTQDLLAKMNKDTAEEKKKAHNQYITDSLLFIPSERPTAEKVLENIIETYSPKV